MRKVIYTFPGFETANYELAEKIKTEKKTPYGVRVEDIGYTPAKIRQRQIELGVIAEDD